MSFGGGCGTHPIFDNEESERKPKECRCLSLVVKSLSTLSQPQIENSTDERCTYGELEELCSRVAAGLRSLGFGPGDMAGFHCVTSLDAIIAFYGVVFAGGRVVLAKPNLSER
ncbi:hypothetical protein HPB52_012322 [Rhipicephalus sanguineus]|uniref:AMP-dependent synthetase/ligase domain-containing protein n=1 Tax=Rhipicephalus sanguineus TaxID=34632 RepID=A0A9D4T9T5_RHISA|nr:hypothetical protein HPB52_012322 [Rhipicephalus sanguineus]